MNRRKVTDIRTKGNLRGGFHRVLYAIAAVLALVGLADAIYLRVEQLVRETAACYRIEGLFREVLGSKYASVGPVPLAAFGALAYFAAFSSAILAAFEYLGFQTLLMLLGQAMFGVTLWLLLLQAFVLDAFCDYGLLSLQSRLLTATAFAAYVHARRTSA